MAKRDRKEADPAASASASALLGEPVDPRRPGHMTRAEYQAARPGDHTATAIKNAGLQRKSGGGMVLWVLLGTAVAVAGLVALLSL
jgi:hypothetical protein